MISKRTKNDGDEDRNMSVNGIKKLHILNIFD